LPKVFSFSFLTLFPLPSRERGIKEETFEPPVTGGRVMIGDYWQVVCRNLSFIRLDITT
jgi:hypothetical protein